MRGFLPVMES